MEEEFFNNTLVKCDNCGAQFDIHEEKCPFCGYINPYGAEEKYMEDMDIIKTNLSKLDDEQAQLIKQERKRSYKIILITIICVICAVGIGIFIQMLYYGRNNAHYAELGIYESDPIEVAKWNDEHLSELDKMYEDGDIEGLVDYFAKLSDDKDYGAFYNWEHNFVITQIYDLRYWGKSLEEDIEVGRDESFALHQLMFDILYYYNGDYMGTDMPEEDYEIVLKEADIQRDKVLDRYGITMEQLDKMNTACCGDTGYVDPQKVSDYVDAHSDMFR